MRHGFVTGRLFKESTLKNLGSATSSIYFRSKMEANWARFLDFRVEQGEIAAWLFEPCRFNFPIERGVRQYVPDFLVIGLPGHEPPVKPLTKEQFQKAWDLIPDHPVQPELPPNQKISETPGRIGGTSFWFEEVKGFMNAQSKTKLNRMKKYFPEVFELIHIIDPTRYRPIAKKLGPIIEGWE